MRTTIVIDDAVFRHARKLAAELDTTLSALVEQALRSALAKPGAKPPRRRFKLVVNKGPGLAPGYAWEDVARRVLASDTSGLP